jgi:hypothetical protein
MAFVIPNRNRDKKFAEGDERYNPNVITYEDITDKQNLHFRYNSESAISSWLESSLTGRQCKANDKKGSFGSWVRVQYDYVTVRSKERSKKE